MNRLIERVLWGGLGRKCGWAYIGSIEFKNHDDVICTIGCNELIL